MEPTTHSFDREEVMAYLDGELAPERAAAAAAHLEQCAECRELAAGLRSLSSQLPQWEVEMMPAAIEQRVLRGANEKAAEVSAPQVDRPAPKRRVVSWLIWGSAISVAALLLLAISLPFTLRSRSPQRWMQEQHDLSTRGPSGSNAVTLPAVPGPPTTLDKKTASRAYDGDSMALRTAPAGREDLAAAGKARANVARPQAGEATRQQEPMIIRRATLSLLTKEFEAARATLENLVKAHQGYFGELNVAAPASQGRLLTATVRVPAGQLDSVLVELRKLGRVEQENQSADDVARQYVDLTARLANARETEKRLVEILRERTGKVGDVLAVEREIARTREQIEQMDAERKTLDSEVRYASIDLRITEEYKQSLDTPAPSLGTRLNNATVGGLRDAADLLIGLILWLLSTVPTLLVLGAILAWPVTRLVRWIRRRLVATPVAAAQ